MADGPPGSAAVFIFEPGHPDVDRNLGDVIEGLLPQVDTLPKELRGACEDAVTESAKIFVRSTETRQLNHHLLEKRRLLLNFCTQEGLSPPAELKDYGERAVAGTEAKIIERNACVKLQQYLNSRGKSNIKEPTLAQRRKVRHGIGVVTGKLMCIHAEMKKLSTMANPQLVPKTGKVPENKTRPGKENATHACAPAPFRRLVGRSRTRDFKMKFKDVFQEAARREAAGRPEGVQCQRCKRDALEPKGVNFPDYHASRWNE
ncbi:unnamed protein product, partial [Mesorhabditis spiculigera]